MPTDEILDEFPEIFMYSFNQSEDYMQNGDPMENLNGLISQLGLECTEIVPVDSEKTHGLYNVTTTEGFDFVASTTESYASVYDIIAFTNARAIANEHSRDFQMPSKKIEKLYKERKKSLSNFSNDDDFTI